MLRQRKCKTAAFTQSISKWKGKDNNKPILQYKDFQDDEKR